MVFFDWHKKQIEWWKKKLNISDYVVAWIGFFKGLVFGFVVGFFIYHYFFAFHF